MKLPRDHESYTDSYLLRSKVILQKEKLNPFVRAQIFVRAGPGRIGGIVEAIKIIHAYSCLVQHEGRVFVLPEGMKYRSSETIMLLEGRIQDIITLETMILGVISAQTTMINDKIGLDFSNIRQRIAQIVKLIGNREVFYFGARHWWFDQDTKIARAAFLGGANGASTDIGAAVVGKKGVGTIPHSLQCIYAWKYGIDKAVIESVKAFDRWIDPSVQRIALVDFRNKEVTDALLCAETLGNRLSGIRIDTCGENLMEGVCRNNDDQAFWSNPGVSIKGVSFVRQALDARGFPKIKIILSSGFGNIQRIQAFVQAERELGIRLFDVLGIGEVFPSRNATMDIIGVGDTIDRMEPIAKIGRSYRENPRLRRV